MKKVLLSLSFLAAVLSANAQNQIVLWNSTSGTTGVTGTPFNFGVPNSGTPPAAVVANPAVDGGLYVDTVSNVIHAVGSCSATKYYVGGFGVGSYSGPLVGKAWGTGVTASGNPLSGYYLNVTIKAAAATGPKIKFQLSASDSTNVQGYILDLSAGTGTANGGYKIYSIPLSAFSNTIGQYGDPINLTGHYMTKAFADSLYKLEYAVNVGTTADGSGAVDFSIKDQWIGTSKTGIVTGTTAAAANIGSSVLFPNPAASEAVFANLTLHTPANVQMIVTDMVGKQITSTNFGTVSTINGLEVFNTTGLAKGSYPVTYVLDGAPAKSQLVVVR